MSKSAAKNRNANVRRNVLDAARTCFQRYGVARTRVEDVAAAAGISRPLLYLHFEGRAGLIEALIDDEIPRFVEANRARIPRDASFAEAFIEGSLAAIEITRSNELLADLLDASSITNLTHLWLDRSRPQHALALGLWKPVFDHGRETGELRPELSDDDILEWLIYVQYILLERPDLDRARQRELIETFVLPALTPPAAR
ncbi:TetR/AcrR family transcriptional regulator [Rhizorhabdus wittichii]|uniref:TetR/AcrR family transcriptional regulator n=1 Tax=Rhizorhabdus wittichii TaxID=160791 RepID=A0A975D5L7_9SPHN|nr:TetR/AcrR family transcriptional regulator [Rhizorhabdus wittichii]QTH23214.1 TetR/AcrR family transcriptional regulator [Rhizorhabdus wittichii]